MPGRASTPWQAWSCTCSRGHGGAAAIASAPDVERTAPWPRCPCVCGTGPRSARGAEPVPPLGWVSSASGSAGGLLSASRAVVDQTMPGRWAPRSDGRLASYGTQHDEERVDAPHPPPLRLLQYYDAPRL